MNPEKILIVQLRRIGDVIFTLPVIEVLRRNFPNAKIDFLVEHPADQIVHLNPYLNETLVYEKKNEFSWIWEVRKRKYDWVLDFHSNGRTLLLTFFSGAPVRAGFSGTWMRKLVYNNLVTTSPKYIVEKKLDFLRKFQLNVNSWKWDLKLPGTELNWAENFLKEAGSGRQKKLVGIACATRRETRAWIPERFAKVAQYLVDNDHDVLFLWGLGEKKLVDTIAKQVSVKGKGKIIIPPQTTLLQLSALMQKCSLVIAVDNGPRNIAVALEKPTVTIFGPTNPISNSPSNDSRHVVVRDEKLFCIACELNQCPYHHECMQNISTESVIKEIEKMLFGIVSI